MVTTTRGARGHTLVEMVVTISVMAILASVILPLAAVTRKREKELQLRSALREIRTALDMYNEACLASPAGGGDGAGGIGRQILPLHVEDDPDRSCYPKDLDLLIEGIETARPKYKLKFLRRIPRDPFNVTDDEHDGHGWIFRSTTDDPDSEGGWDRKNVFDVRSGSESQALDGSFYADW